MLEAYASTQGSGNQKDALVYCHESLSRLTDLAQALSEHSPVAATTTVYQLDPIEEVNDLVRYLSRNNEE